MNRRFSYAQILAAVAVLVIAVVAIGALTRSKDTAEDTDGQKFVPCPSSTPDACADRIAQMWQKEARPLPTIAIPAGLRYDRGFIGKKGVPAAFYVFQKPVDGSTQPTELTLRISPASPTPYDVAHRGGKLRHLPNGHTYLDYTNAQKSGPFVEHLGDVEVVMSWTSSAAPESVKAAQLDILNGVTAR